MSSSFECRLTLNNGIGPSAHFQQKIIPSFLKQYHFSDHFSMQQIPCEQKKYLEDFFKYPKHLIKLHQIVRVNFLEEYFFQDIIFLILKYYFQRHVCVSICCPCMRCVRVVCPKTSSNSCRRITRCH